MTVERMCTLFLFHEALAKCGFHEARNLPCDKRVEHHSRECGLFASANAHLVAGLFRSPYMPVELTATVLFWCLHRVEEGSRGRVMIGSAANPALLLCPLEFFVTFLLQPLTIRSQTKVFIHSSKLPPLLP